ncbi:hypothetical protein KKB44_02365 [Candidatus Micrarchaeota archaeon]|nr:hypothetical protein [Candidatus Micrarchaeota archaeon]
MTTKITDLLKRMKEAQAPKDEGKVIKLPLKPKPPEPLVESLGIATGSKPESTACKGHSEERSQDKSEKPIILTDTVRRIYFGRVITAPTHDDCGEHSYILGFGKKPLNVRAAHLREVGAEENMEKSGDSIFQQLSVAVAYLDLYSMPLEEGPYADKDGLVAELAREIAKGAKDTLDLVDRIIDILRPVVGTEVEARFPRVHVSGKYSFELNEHFGMLPDEAPTAGQILAHEDRYYMNRSTGRETIVLAHMMEPFILAASVLRRNDLHAYPALGILPIDYGEERYVPLMTLIDLTKDVPLTTFALMRDHPPMASIDVISDTAMMGVLSTIHAEQRVKHLTLELVQQLNTGKTLSEDETTNQLNRVADALFDCHTVWPGCHFIGDSLVFLAQDVAETMMAIYLNDLRVHVERAARENPMLAIPGAIEQEASQTAFQIGQRYREYVLHQLKLKIATSAAE